MSKIAPTDSFPRFILKQELINKSKDAISNIHIQTAPLQADPVSFLPFPSLALIMP